MHGLRCWDLLTLDEGKQLTAEWESSRTQRLAWLEAELGLPLERSQAYVERAWEWYVEWRGTAATITDLPPPPVWWDPTEAGEPTFATPVHAVGTDALAHLVEEVLVAESPVPLIRAYDTTKAPRRSRYIWTNSPILVPASQPDATSTSVLGLVDMWHNRASGGRRNKTPNTEIQAYLEWFGEFRDGHPEGHLPPTVEIIRELGGDEPMWYVELTHDGDLSQDAVDELADALQALAGVSEAFHQDRDQIVVTGEVDLATLQSATQKWLASRASS